MSDQVCDNCKGYRWIQKKYVITDAGLAGRLDPCPVCNALPGKQEA